jgi:hypothetical protein
MTEQQGPQPPSSVPAITAGRCGLRKGQRVWWVAFSGRYWVLGAIAG